MLFFFLIFCTLVLANLNLIKKPIASLTILYLPIIFFDIANAENLLFTPTQATLISQTSLLISI